VIINILCDIVTDVVDVNMKTRPLTSVDRALIRASRVEKGWGVRRMMKVLGTCKSFFLRSNRISNRIGRPIRFQIEFSSRIGRIYHKYLIHSIGIYFVFVTNESDARN